MPRPTKKKVAVRKATLPANIEEQLKALATEQGATVSSGAQRIQVTRDGFKFPDGEVAPSPMTVVVLAHVNRNIYYEGAFVEGNVTPPTCMGQGFVKHDDLVPLEGVSEPQSDACKVCPQHAFGSASRGGRACKQRTLLGVIAPDGISEDDTIFPLDASVMSTISFGSYVSMLKSRYDRPALSFLTEMSIVPAGTGVSVSFKSVGPNENAHIHLTRLAEANEIINQTPQLSKTEDKPAPRRINRKKVTTRRAR